jgi:hypothetical protein
MSDREGERRRLGPLRFTWTCKQCGRVVPQRSWLHPVPCEWCPPPPNELQEKADEFNKAVANLGNALLKTAPGHLLIWLMKRLNALAIKLGF